MQHLDPQTREHLWKIIGYYHRNFTLTDDSVPCTNLVSHEIILKSGKIINVKSYRPPECHRAEVERQTQEMLEKGIIRPSNSPFNSPLWVVPKKADASGKKKWRLVIDFRKLNEDTDQDAYPLPVIDDILSQLGNAKFFSAFDLSSGFHQIPMADESKKYTGFSTERGHWEFNRMPFGLKNAPATFQRLMDRSFQGLVGKACFVYLDDIVIFGNTLEEHNRNLVSVMERVEELGLKLQPDKCEYLRPELEYLGHLITKNGVKPNPAKIEAIENFKPPTNVTQVQSFLGLTGYYRKFIKNFSHIAKPLTNLTQKDTIFDWTTECQCSFELLKELLCKAPVLKYPDFTKTFTLTTDASNVGIGAVLSQDGHPNCFISRTLNKAEQNYNTAEKELLAIVWATKRLRQYLLGRKFLIQTDHKALQWLNNVKDPSSRLLRWRLRLEEFEYEISYVKGKENKAADCLSRLFPIQVEKDILQSALEDIDLEVESPATEILDTSTGKNPDVSQQQTEMETPNTEIIQNYSVNYGKWKEQPTETIVKIKPNAIGKLWRKITKTQLSAFDTEKWLQYLQNTIKEFTDRKLTLVRIHLDDPLITPVEREELFDMIKYVSTLHPTLKFNICFSNTTELTKEDKLKIIKEVHGSPIGQHFGENKSIEKAKRLGIWRGMEEDIIKYVKSCPVCQLQKTTRITSQAKGLIPDIPLKPNDKIAMDIFGPLPITHSGNKFILSIQDRLTRFITLVPMKNASSEEIIENLLDQYIYIFGTPKNILTDQGSNFISELVQQFEYLFKIEHIKTTAWHPQSNGNIERMHSTIKNLIKTAIEDNKTEWDMNLKLITLAYNTTISESTGYTPFELTFGREANIPSSLTKMPTVTYDQLIEKWKKQYELWIIKAREKIQLQMEKAKKRIDENIVRTQPLYNIGDLVKWKNNNLQHKLEPSWKGPGIIVQIFDNNNVEIKYNNKIFRLHLDQVMPYYVLDEAHDDADNDDDNDTPLSQRI